MQYLTDITPVPSAAALRSLRQMVSGHMTSRAVFAGVDLGFFDALSSDVQHYTEIARQVRCDDGATLRLLRALASLGLAQQVEPALFRDTYSGNVFRRDASPSLRHIALLSGSERSWRAWDRLGPSIRSGEPARTRDGAMELPYWQRVPEDAGVHEAAAAEMSALVAAALVRAYDFERHDTIVDIGGGDGVLLCAMLEAVPLAEGTLFDSGPALAAGRARLKEADLLFRSEVLAGDFFQGVPGGRDLYVLKNVLRDWDEQSCLTILSRIRSAMHPSSRLMIVEPVLPELVMARPEHQQVTLMDLDLLVAHGGRERTAREFQDLLSRCSMRLVGAPRQLPDSLPCSLILASPL